MYVTQAVRRNLQAGSPAIRSCVRRSCPHDRGTCLSHRASGSRPLPSSHRERVNAKFRNSFHRQLQRLGVKAYTAPGLRAAIVDRLAFGGNTIETGTDPKD